MTEAPSAAILAPWREATSAFIPSTLSGASPLRLTALTLWPRRRSSSTIAEPVPPLVPRTTCRPLSLIAGSLLPVRQCTAGSWPCSLAGVPEDPLPEKVFRTGICADREHQEPSQGTKPPVGALGHQHGASPIISIANGQWAPNGA